MGRLLRALRRLLIRLVVLVGALGFAALLALNLSVRFIGDSHPAPWSIFFLNEKRAALEAFARHLPECIVDDHDASAPLIRRAARRHGLPPDFVMKLAQTESALLPHRISPSGAMGVMQLMPATAGDLGVRDPFDSTENIDAGARYLAWLWKRYGGDRARVAAAYNAGPGRVPIDGPLPTSLPNETKAYVLRITGFAIDPV